MEAVLATLLNDLDAMTNDIVLVLDDFHLIDRREVAEAMAFLLEHLPAQLHLVIAGRGDPALPLALLRSRGELVEIRSAELRFTPAEAAVYLNECMELTLTADDVAALEGRTEGWIAALQLAALSMQGRDDVAAFIAGFAGDDRYIVDYLLAGDDFERAADLVELAIPVMRRTRQEAVLREWLDALPDESIRSRPVLSVSFAGVLLLVGELPGIEAQLQNAERWLVEDDGVQREAGVRSIQLGVVDGGGAQVAGVRPEQMVVVDEEEFRRLPAMIQLYRAALALARGELLDAVTYARRALDLAPDGDSVSRAPAAGLFGARLPGRRRPRGRAPGLCRMHGRALPGGVRRRHLRLRDRAGRHPDCAGSSGRCTSHLRTGPTAGR